jgi:hypothetical protein
LVRGVTAPLLDHDALPAVATAPLPETYETAKLALAECVRVDECKQWADRAAALASYAKQADDKALRQMAIRIQARAIRRCGELLNDIEPAQGGDRRSEQWNQKDGTVPLITREQAATDAGLSERQRKTALRVNNLPREQFDQGRGRQAANGDKARRAGNRKAGATGRARRPIAFRAATALLGLVTRFVVDSERLDIPSALRGFDTKEREVTIDRARTAAAWLDRFCEEASCTARAT